MNVLRSLLALLRRIAVWLLLLPIRFYQLAISPYSRARGIIPSRRLSLRKLTSTEPTVRHSTRR